MTLKPVGDGCELHTLHTITAKMPIILKKSVEFG
jgi:hypothetical protein